MKLSLTIVLAAVASTSALTSPTDRRGAFKNLLGAGAGAFLATAMPQAASATAAKTGAANPFSGDYNDPNHPECLRQVKVVGAPLKGDGTRSPYPVIEVVGYDGKGGKVCTDRPTRDDLWKVEGTVKGADTAVSENHYNMYRYCYQLRAVPWHTLNSQTGWLTYFLSFCILMSKLTANDNC